MGELGAATEPLAARPGRSLLTAAAIEKAWGPSRAIGAGTLGLSARVSSVAPSRGTVERSRPQCDETHAISVWFEGATFSELYLNGAKRFAATRNRDSFQLARAGESVRAILSNSSGGCIDLYVPHSLLDRFLETELHGARGALELLPVALERDDEITALALRIAREIEHPDVGCGLAVDGASLLLSAALIRRWSNQSRRVRRPGGGLAPWQVRRVLALMNATTSSSLTLARLSSEVGLSPYHFARAFKVSVGETPHQHHLKIRLERARALLETSNRTISSIGADVGFDDTSYFARVFKSMFSLRPKEYRMSRRF